MNQLNVTHVVGSIAKSRGGTSQSVHLLCENLTRCGCRTNICTTDDHLYNDSAAPVDTSLVNLRQAHIIQLPGRITFARQFRQTLSSVSHDSQIIHSHGLWLKINHDSSMVAEKNKKIHIISTRGMLQPWALNHKSWRKKLAGYLYQNKNLRTATCFHATSYAEAENIRQLGLTNPIAIIPNGIDITPYTQINGKECIISKWPQLKGKKIALFLSRIHPIKGLLNLAEAWAGLYKDFPNWQLVIAGPDENGYQKQIQAALAATGADTATTFTGPVENQSKYSLYALCDIFVLPTHSENFGIVVAEALAAAKPVITTKAAPWSDLQKYNCGWQVDCDAESLRQQLRSAMLLLDKQRDQMGQRGRQLVKQKFSWTAIANSMIATYAYLMGSATKPDCIILS
jgi:glycosyltransferase involved in cell wall biosynthesis